MKRLYSLLLIIVFIPSLASSQSCLPDGIIFSTQAEIDSFQINYPGCTEIEGTVIISGVDIYNLNGLSILTSIGEYFEIIDNNSLTSLTGLENLASLRDLWIQRNDRLGNLTGLENVVSITRDVWIYGNDSLINLTGLENVNFIEGGLRIDMNNELINLSGLDNLTSIGNYLEIDHNKSLVSLTSLANLTSIGSNLFIWSNDSLTSLTGLNNINPGSIIDLGIAENPFLSTCEVESICNYLSSPNGEMFISDNAIGCNDQEEVEEACEVSSVYEIHISDQLSINPNPFSTSTTIEYTLQHPSTVQIIIYNHFGEKIDVIRQQQSSGKQQVVWNAEGLPSGVYYYRIQAGDQMASEKMILLK